MKKILILGGYGNFGKRIALALAKANISIIIAGRHPKAATDFLHELKIKYPQAQVDVAIFDINKDLTQKLQELQPLVVINTCGPFQTTNYDIAETCIKQKVHYIDLADARDFVNGITILDKKAKANDVLVISGASTVPGLSTAVVDFYLPQFLQIDSLIFGITPGQKAPRGLATTQSILTYLGKPLKQIGKNQKQQYGWQDLYLQTYPDLGKRWMANCDIPDLDIFPEKYNIKSVRFSAGMENSLLHLGMWLTSWLVRLGLPINLTNHAALLLKTSHLFDYFGSADGGMHMIIEGSDKQGNPKKIQWFIIAKNGDGPQIPCVPAIILAKKLIANELTERGAFPCVSKVSLDEYMDELRDFAITTKEIK